jgi:uncharacterized protein YjbJ (UPF0337 family)
MRRPAKAMESAGRERSAGRAYLGRTDLTDAIVVSIALEQEPTSTRVTPNRSVRKTSLSRNGPESALTIVCTHVQKENTMLNSTKQELEGKLRETKGSAKEELGEATNDPQLESEGRTEKVAGIVQKALGKVEKALGK